MPVLRLLLCFLSIACLSAGEVNDDFANATTLADPHGFTISGMTTDSSVEADEPLRPGVTLSLWWTWTPPSSGLLFRTMDEEAAFFSIFTGSTLAGLTPIAPQTPPEHLSGLFQAAYPVTAGVPIQVQVSSLFPHPYAMNCDFSPAILDISTTATGVLATEDTIDLAVRFSRPVARNANPEPILALDGLPSPATFDRIDAGDARIVHFTYTVQEGDYAERLAVAPVLLQSNGLSTVDDPTLPVGDLTPGGLTTAVAIATIANDLVGHPTAISGGTLRIQADTALAHEDSSAPEAGPHSLWWSWTAPATGNLFLTDLGITGDLQVSLFTGTPGALVSVPSMDDENYVDDDGDGETDEADELHPRFAVTTGTTYRIAVSSAGGVVDLRLSPTAAWISGITAWPTGYAEAGAVLTFEVRFSEAMTFAAPSARLALDLDGSTRWAALASTDSNVMRFTYTIQGGDHAALLALSGAGALDLQGGTVRTMILGHDADPATPALTGAISVLDAVARPANDDFADATVVTGTRWHAEAFNAGATSEATEPDHRDFGKVRSLWWAWTAPSSGRWVLTSRASNALGEPYGVLLGLYTGDTLASLTTVPSSRSAETVFFDAVAGTTYRIAACDGNAERPADSRAGTVVLDAGPATRVESVECTLADGIQGANLEQIEVRLRFSANVNMANGSPAGLMLAFWPRDAYAAFDRMVNPRTASFLAMRDQPMGFADGYTADLDCQATMDGSSYLTDANGLPVDTTIPTGSATGSLASLRAIVIGTPPPAPVFDPAAWTIEVWAGQEFTSEIRARVPDYDEVPLTYSATGLPSGVTLDANGLLSGMAAPGTYAIAVSATGPGGTGSGTLTLHAVLPDAPVWSLDVAPVVYGKVGTALTVPAGALANTPGGGGDDDGPAGFPVTYSLVGSPVLPAGLTWSPSGLAGTPTAAGTVTLTIRATNDGGSVSRTCLLVIEGAAVPANDQIVDAITIVPAATPTGAGAVLWETTADAWLATSENAELDSLDSEDGEPLVAMTRTLWWRTPATDSRLVLEIEPLDPWFEPTLRWYDPLGPGTGWGQPFLSGIGTRAWVALDHPGQLLAIGGNELMRSGEAGAFRLRVVRGPVLTGVTIAPPPAGNALLPGETIDLFVGTSEPLTVTGSPVLRLANGGSATFISASDSTLRFSYEALPGENTDRIDIAGTDALDATGCTIVSTSGSVPAALTLPAAGEPGTPGCRLAVARSDGVAVADPPPANDQWADRISVSGADLRLTGSTIGATGTSHEATLAGWSDPSHTYRIEDAVHGIWYRWQAPAAGTWVISDAGSGIGGQPGLLPVSLAVLRPGTTAPLIAPRIGGIPSELAFGTRTVHAVTITSSAAGQAFDIFLASADEIPGEGDPPADPCWGSAALTITGGPAALAVRAANPDGTYNAGETIAIEVLFSEPVTVTGSPELVLATWPSTRRAVYAAGSGSRRLAFAYTVQPGDLAWVLDLAQTVIAGGGIAAVADPAQTASALPGPGTPAGLTAWSRIRIGTAVAPPRLDVPATAAGTVGTPFSLALHADRTGLAWSASGLPAGLAIDSADGTISGSPAAVGTFAVTITAGSDGGVSQAALRLTIAAPTAPVVTATPLTATVFQGYSHQFTASRGPLTWSWSADVLPPGLTLDATGLLSGTPVRPGIYSLTIRGADAWTQGEAVVVLTVGLPAAPVFTGPASAGGTVGQAFSLTLTANNGVSGWGALGLPPGLTLDPLSGVISGTPTSAGYWAVLVVASNPGGMASGTVVITIAGAGDPPVVVSAANTIAVAGSPFSFQLAASGNPTLWSATGLPAWLSLDGSTGLLSGTPPDTGLVVLGIAATNAHGIGRGQLAITVQPTGTAAATNNSSSDGGGGCGLGGALGLIGVLALTLRLRRRR